MKLNINKKHITTLALAGIILSSPAVAMAAEFKDVPANHWAYSYISRLSDAGIIAGYPDKTYKPSNSVQYLEVLRLLQGVMGPSSTEVAQAVKDKGHIADSYGVASWAKEAVCVALARNVITETNLKQAAIEGLVSQKVQEDFPSRQTIAVYYARALNLQPSKDHSVLKHKDLDKLGVVNDAKIGNVNVADYLAALVKAGIFAAEGADGYFEPNRPIQRAEMATITDLSYKYMKEAGNAETIEAKVLYVADINGRTIALTKKDGSTTLAKASATTKYTKNGQAALPSDLKEGQSVKIKARKSSDNNYDALEIEIVSTDRKATGKVTSIAGNTLTISYKEGDQIDLTKSFFADKTEAFTLGQGVKLMRYGKEVSFSNIGNDDYVEFVAQDNTIKEINLIPKSAVVTGTIKYDSTGYGINGSFGKVVMTLDNGKTYEFSIIDPNLVGQAMTAARNATQKYDVTLNYKNPTKIDTAIITNVNEGMLTGFNRDNIILNIGNASKEYVLGSTVSIRQEGPYKTSYTKEEAFNKLFPWYKDSMVRLKEENGKVTEITIMTQPLTMYSINATITAQEPASSVSGFDNGTRYSAEYVEGGSTTKISFITEDSYVNGSSVRMTIYKEDGKVIYLKVEDKFVAKSN